MRTQNGLPSWLSDRELVDAIARLAGNGRQTTADLVAHLAELYGRRLHERAGFSSLFTYCVEVLHFSDSEELIAVRFPQLDVVSSIRKLPVSSPVPSATPMAPAVSAIASGAPASAPSLVGREPAADDVSIRLPVGTPAPPVIQPLAVDRWITFTADAQTREKFELARDLLRHAIPSGDPAQIFARSLDVLVEQLVKQRSRSRAVVERAGANQRTRVTSPRTYSGRSTYATAAAAPSSAPTGGGAGSAPSWSSTTSCPTGQAGALPSRTSSFAAAPTTAMRPRCSMARRSATPVAW